MTSDPSQDHTDKSLLERAEELIRRLRAFKAKPLPPYDWPAETKALDDAAQVISELLSSVRSVSAGTKDDADYQQMVNETIEERDHLLDEVLFFRNKLDAAQATIASLREELDRMNKRGERIDSERDAYCEALWIEANRADHEAENAGDPNTWDVARLRSERLRRILDEKEPNR